MTILRKDKSQSGKLVLGTAQLGMPYGINNRTGEPDQRTATAIIAEAYKLGIREFDTAQAYGKSEEALGRAITELSIGKSVQIISKIHPAANLDDLSSVEISIKGSLNRLGVPKLRGLMLHHEDALDNWDAGLGKFFMSMVKAAVTELVGVSTYTPAKAIVALNKKEVSFIQVPANLADRRFEQAGVFDLAEKLEKTVYIRSVFLQGLLLMDETDVPLPWAQAEDIVKRIASLAETSGYQRLHLALGYVHWRWPQARIIFGAELPQQVGQNVEAFEKPLDPHVCRQIEEIFSDVDERLLNPSLWPQTIGKK